MRVSTFIFGCTTPLMFILMFCTFFGKLIADGYYELFKYSQSYMTSKKIALVKTVTAYGFGTTSG